MVQIQYRRQAQLGCITSSNALAPLMFSAREPDQRETGHPQQVSLQPEDAMTLLAYKLFCLAALNQVSPVQIQSQ
jgi:hypothetical protein